MQKSGVLSTTLAGSIQAFYDMRSRLVHSGDVADDDVLRALDSGLTLWKALQAIPIEVNTVEETGVPIYAEPELRTRLEGWAVILKTVSPGGAVETLRIFPTTRTHFQKGKRVAWEWSMGHIWGPAWYRDPKTDEVKQAWGSSAEFIGRHLEEA